MEEFLNSERRAAEEPFVKITKNPPPRFKFLGYNKQELHDAISNIKIHDNEESCLEESIEKHYNQFRTNTSAPEGEELEAIFRSDGQRVYRLGERGSGYEERNFQDFQSLRAQCLEEGVLFEDPAFPADYTSLQITDGYTQFTWLRPSEIVSDPQLFVEGFSRFDVRQGELGDCWLLAAIANLTLHQKLFFQIVPDDQCFQNDYAGIFHFRFWKYGKWIDVIVDDRLPTYNGRLVFLHSAEKNEFWSALFEKAYAKLHGSYESLKGGSTSEAMEDFTGGLTESFELNDIPSNFFTIMLHAYERNSLMGCSINPDPEVLEAETPQGLIRGHAYSITRVCYVDIETPRCKGRIPLLRIRNPWGNEAEWNGAWSDKSPEWQYIPESEKERVGLTFDNDGEFWMSYKDFTTYFERMKICNFNPDSLDPEDIQPGCNKKWVMGVFEGEWVKGVTAGGCRNYMDTFWQNPQYTLTLKDPDEDDDEDKCTAVVSLMQKKRRSVGLDHLTIGFSVYSQNPDSPRPLPRTFFERNISVARNPVFINSREVNCRVKLPPGTYCIVPSTFDPNEDGEFLLRIFTETSSSLTENDETIGTITIDERIVDDIPEPPSDPEDPLMKYFVKLAGEDEEIDWSELKVLLDYSIRDETIINKCSERSCRFMVSMSDKDDTGKLGFEEFKILWLDVFKWRAAFKLYDPNGSGWMPLSRLRNALNSSGFTVDNHTLNILVKSYRSNDEHIGIDNFFMCAVYMKKTLNLNRNGA